MKGRAIVVLAICACMAWAVASAATETKKMTKEEEEQSILEDLQERLDEVMDDIRESAEAVVQGVGQVMEGIKDGADIVADSVADVLEDVGEALGIIAVDEVENQLEAAWKKTALIRSVVGQGLVGAAVMLFGVHFSQSIILAHTIRVTGWPILVSAVHDLIYFYKRAREAIRKEFPNLKKAREILDAVKFEAEALRKISQEARQQRQHGKITQKEAAAIIRQAEVDMRQLNKKSYVLNQALSSVSAITGAIDVNKLKDIFKGVWTSVLACLAASSSATVRTLSMGFDLAGIIGKHLDHIFQSILHKNTVEVFRALPHEAQKLLGVCVSVLSLIKGILLIKVILPQMSLSISSSALGAAWVSNALVEVADARAGGAGKGLLSDKTLYMLTHVALTLTGVIFQAHHAEELPLWVQKALWPAIRAEQELRRLEWGKKAPPKVETTSAAAAKAA